MIEGRSVVLTNAPQTVLVKRRQDHHVVQSDFCGEIREVLRDEYAPLGTAVIVDIGPTVPHFHSAFDEIYLVVDGDLTLQLYDPRTNCLSEEKLGENELCVIPAGVHHGVTSSSRHNRLYAITSPPFVRGDETRSDKIASPRQAGRFETKVVPADKTDDAPDGSEVRVLLHVPRAGLAQFRLGPGEIASAVVHRTVDEIWYVASGNGEMWRRDAKVEETVPLAPGVCVTVPGGTRFQFRCSGPGPLEIVGVTTPPWPGAGEAVLVEGKWRPTVGGGITRVQGVAP